ncbi:hypothetical protein [Lacinutrix sp. Hel_I_90]|uniref:hypothetical protein n=1 Tax=Lacinutrix sp. Hel_I_90 TaxID=1249999 RepID=UPI000AFBA299|nr:hypothetical protein [Lacinutrix sp. Hel_I_90]
MKKPFLPIVFLVLFFICILSCSDSSNNIPKDTTTGTNTETDPDLATSNEPINFVFS